MKEDKMYKLKEYLQNNLETSKQMIEDIINKNIEKIKFIELEKNATIDIIKIKAGDKQILLTICKKEEATNFAYKYWSYYYLRNINQEDIKVLSKINMQSYNFGKHHDILEISDENDKINIKLHYFQNQKLQEKDIITEDELLVLLEN